MTSARSILNRVRQVERKLQAEARRAWQRMDRAERMAAEQKAAVERRDAAAAEGDLSAMSMAELNEEAAKIAERLGAPAEVPAAYRRLLELRYPEREELQRAVIDPWCARLDDMLADSKRAAGSSK
jgi:hypothetical protein